MKKRSKSMQIVVDIINERLLREDYVSDDKKVADLMSFISYALMLDKTYKGFNYYKYDERGNLVLAGEQTKLIQFY